MMQPATKRDLWTSVGLVMAAALVGGMVCWLSGSERVVDYVRDIALFVGIVLVGYQLWRRRRGSANKPPRQS